MWFLKECRLIEEVNYSCRYDKYAGNHIEPIVKIPGRVST